MVVVQCCLAEPWRPKESEMMMMLTRIRKQNFVAIQIRMVKREEGKKLNKRE